MNRNTGEMNRDNKNFEAEESDMTALPREKSAQPSPQSGGANTGDELGPNTEIGSKLRALYTSIQDETIPDRFLDLLEKLDQVERKLSSASRN